MITSGYFKKTRFYTVADSVSGANMVKSGLVGKNSFMITPPFGNRFNLVKEGNNLIFDKVTGAFICYEEAKSIIKKIAGIGRIQHLNERQLLDSCRSDLESRFSIFFPEKKGVKIEVNFFYNWITIEFEKNCAVEIVEMISQKMIELHPSYRVYAKGSNSLAIINYSMEALNLTKQSLFLLGKAMAENSIINADDVKKFALRTYSCGLKSLIYNESRNIAQHADDKFNFDDDADFNPEIGDRKFLSTLSTALEWLEKKGLFLGLSDIHINTLAQLARDPSQIESFTPSPTIRTAILNFIEDYKSDIEGIAF